jgi:AcrR family transcriptional regulator
VRIEALAEALGVTKGGFYWHFDDRRALLEEMLDTWERVVSDEAIERVEEGGDDARSKLERLLTLASSEQARALGSIDLAIREWARRDQSFGRGVGLVTRLWTHIRPPGRGTPAWEEEAYGLRRALRGRTPGFQIQPRKERFEPVGYPPVSVAEQLHHGGDENHPNDRGVDEDRGGETDPDQF